MHSYQTIHNIFYSNKKYGYEDILRLQKYGLTNDLLLLISDAIQSDVSTVSTDFIPVDSIENKEKETSKEPPENGKSDSKKENISTFQKSDSPKYWIPDKSDTLFWTVFISVNGFSEYYQIGHLYGKRILEEKMKIAKWIKENPKMLKTSNYKFTNESIQETMSEFMVDQTTSFNGVAALALYYKRTIYLLDEKRKIYLKFLSENTTQPIHIYYHDFMRGNHKYKILTQDNEVDSSFINDWFCLETVLKPLKSISNYKADELNAIANKLGVELPLKIKKTELYELLVKQYSWSKETIRK
jgi:hypothetical protein